jgi:hypothetical protein
MIEYLRSVYEEWLVEGGEEPLVCTECYSTEECFHGRPKWPVSHLLNKLELDEKIWTKSNSSRR